MNSALWIAIAAGAIALATPLIIAGLGETLVERAGRLNLGIEGMMAMGAFVGIWAASAAGPWMGLLAALAAGVVMAAAMNLAVYRFGANEVVVGLAMTILGLGLSTYLYLMWIPAGEVNRSVETLPTVSLGPLADVPVLGPVLFQHDIMVYLLVPLVLGFWALMRHTTVGLRIHAVGTDPESARLRDEAVVAASAAEVVVLFLGLPARLESEGYDRDDIHLPAEQLAVLEAVRAANPNVVVVLSNGGVVALPFAGDVPAILEGWLLGQAGGGATADALFGDINPSAKLTETIPVRLSDTPAYLDFPGEFGHVRYGEGLFVGYRWYDARGLEVAYPFGHGLSYTTFAYADAAARVTDGGDLEVVVTVTNTGQRDGREVVQVYTSLPESTVQRPVRELRGFASVALAAGESRTVVIPVRRADLAYWDIRVDGWVVEGGGYTVEIGASSRDIRGSATVEVAGDPVKIPLTRESSLAEVIAHPVVGEMVQGALQQMMAGMDGLESVMPEGVSMDKMMLSFPIGRMSMMAGDQVSPEMIDGLIAMANAPQQ